jgi:aerobic-type carbon monoxide dehydrogenase small subunit (CoxS/CutS family)
MAIDFELNGESVSLDVDPAMPLLWAIRYIAGRSIASRLSAA